MGSFWQNLHWPVAIESFGYTSIIMKVRARVCMHVCIRMCMCDGWGLCPEALDLTVRLQAITESALYYVEAVYGDLKYSDIHDDQGHFRATKRV